MSGSLKIALFFLTALAEIVGCYLPYLWLREGKSIWLLFPAGICLILFSWLLTLHPEPAGRNYAIYGGIYVISSILWMWSIEGFKPDRWDVIGGGITLLGVSVIAFFPR